MGASPNSPGLLALYRATWFLVHEADARAAVGDVSAAQAFYTAVQFLVEVRKELLAAQAFPAAPTFPTERDHE